MVQELMLSQKEKDLFNDAKEGSTLLDKNYIP